MLILRRKKKRTTMIKPTVTAAAATLDVVPSSRVGGEILRTKTKKKKMMTIKDKLLEEEEEYDVPMDIWTEILFRLPFITLLGLRFVCRVWNDIITRSHHHRNLTPAALLGYSRDSVHPYLTLVDLPSGGEPSAPFKHVRHPCTIHDCSLIHKCQCMLTPHYYRHLLAPIASCHGLVCFTDHTHIFVGNPLLNEELLMVPGSMTKPETAAMEKENTEDGMVKDFRHIVGFGFSPKINRYKIMRIMTLWVYTREWHEKPGRPPPVVDVFQICTIDCHSSSGEHEESPPSWRSLRGSPPQFAYHGKRMLRLGLYLKGGMHWLFCDSADDDYIFVSRLDLDTEEFGRLQVPPPLNCNKTSGKLNLNDMCANIFNQNCDIWVMKGYNSWTKQFVVRSPVAFAPSIPFRRTRVFDRRPWIKLLNYAAAVASHRGGAVSEVMLIYNKTPLFACTTEGGQVRNVELPLGVYFIVYTPTFLSIKDAAKM